MGLDRRGENWLGAAADEPNPKPTTGVNQREYAKKNKKNPKKKPKSELKVLWKLSRLLSVCGKKRRLSATCFLFLLIWNDNYGKPCFLLTQDYVHELQNFSIRASMFFHHTGHCQIHFQYSSKRPRPVQEPPANKGFSLQTCCSGPCLWRLF